MSAKRLQLSQNWSYRLFGSYRLFAISLYLWVMFIMELCGLLMIGHINHVALFQCSSWTGFVLWMLTERKLKILFLWGLGASLNYLSLSAPVRTMLLQESGMQKWLECSWNKFLRELNSGGKFSAVSAQLSLIHFVNRICPQSHPCYTMNIDV